MNKDLKKGIIWFMAIPLLYIIVKCFYFTKSSYVIIILGKSVDFYDLISVISFLILIISSYYFASLSQTKKLTILIPIFFTFITVAYLLMFNLSALFD